jgi:regulator of sirC expression with transglutaminase-like and TPR domain
MIDFLNDFAIDTEFRKLLGRASEIDLTTAALELARDAEPQLTFEPVHDWIAARARELTGPLARASSDEELIAELGRCLAERHGIRGTRESYESAEGSFLNRVIENRAGIPISLSVLYMAVAERAGVTLQGVSAPAHFLTRYEAPDEVLFIDAYASGEVLTLVDCIARVQNSTGVPREVAMSALEPVGPRQIIIRMLNNLKALYANQENWPALWRVQHRLLALQPSSHAERRDWGVASLKAGKTGPAIDMLNACLETCPTDERPALEQHLEEARRRQARWN